MRKKLRKKAVDIFNTHKDIDTIYLTIDGQGFTEEHNANEHARVLGKNSKVVKFDRTTMELEDPEADEDITASGNDESLIVSDNVEKAAPKDKPDMVSECTESIKSIIDANYDGTENAVKAGDLVETATEDKSDEETEDVKQEEDVVVTGGDSNENITVENSIKNTTGAKKNTKKSNKK